MGRVAAVAGIWFLFWIAVGAIAGYLTGGDQGGRENWLYFGGIYGAIFAFVSSFAWPWILPEVVQEWMDRQQ